MENTADPNEKQSLNNTANDSLNNIDRLKLFDHFRKEKSNDTTTSTNPSLRECDQPEVLDFGKDDPLVRSAHAASVAPQPTDHQEDSTNLSRRECNESEVLNFDKDDPLRGSFERTASSAPRPLDQIVSDIGRGRIVREAPPKPRPDEHEPRQTRIRVLRIGAGDSDEVRDQPGTSFPPIAGRPIRI